MAYDEHLAVQVRSQLSRQSGVVEKRMFGGVAFLLNGNMAVGIHRDALIVRTSAEKAEAALKESGIRVFDITGRPMKGWLIVEPRALKEPQALARWIKCGVDYAASLPKK